MMPTIMQIPIASSILDVEIKTGKLSGNDIEVLSGIQNNDLVISVGFQGLNDGDEILVK